MSGIYGDFYRLIWIITIRGEPIGHWTEMRRTEARAISRTGPSNRVSCRPGTPSLLPSQGSMIIRGPQDQMYMPIYTATAPIGSTAEKAADNLCPLTPGHPHALLPGRKRGRIFTRTGDRISLGEGFVAMRYIITGNSDR